ncbi:MAG: hypothetical protein HY435_01765 [Candidatus Liptonbacteria bacterium]|nr:hypothetical protein [Candidatus Liptonbacteria bacterium]
MGFLNTRSALCLVLGIVAILFFSPRVPSAHAANPYIQNVFFGQDEGGDYLSFHWVGIPNPADLCSLDTILVWFNRYNPVATTTGAIVPELLNGDFYNPRSAFGDDNYGQFGIRAFASGFTGPCFPNNPDLNSALPRLIKAYINPGLPPEKLSFAAVDFITVQLMVSPSLPRPFPRPSFLGMSDLEQYFYQVPANPLPVIPYTNVKWGFDANEHLTFGFDWVGPNKEIFLHVGLNGAISDLPSVSRFEPDPHKDISAIFEEGGNNNLFHADVLTHHFQVERGRHYDFPVRQFHLWTPFNGLLTSCNRFILLCLLERRDVESVMRRGFLPDDYVTVAVLARQYTLNDSTKYFFETKKRFSNVAFLPGLMGSRLYKQQIFENQLWEPNRNGDVQKLFLDDEGEPLDPAIYARDIIDESNIVRPKPLVGFNIYKNFITSMDTMVSDGVINAWKPFPYDWRMPLENIVNNGIQLQSGTQNLIAEIEALASSSATGKVTLVTHSNGGLLAKVLVNRLRDLGEDRLIDRMIMVASPQLGTPAAIAGLLHGDDQEIPKKLGIFLSKSTARELGENMASAYNLLPSEEYFNRVLDPVVEFDDEVRRIPELAARAGTTITTAGDFRMFLAGDAGSRTEPPPNSFRVPNVLKPSLLVSSSVVHDLLDAWVPPPSIEVVQIAGWGKDTVRGIEYDLCDICLFHSLENLDHGPRFTSDGDGTVVIPSATGMEEQVFYVNLQKHNEIGQFKRNRAHGDIMEVESLQELIQNIVQNSVDLNNLPQHITVTKPGGAHNLRIGVHSPVLIDIYDSLGNHTGLIENPDPKSDLQLVEEQIPNSSIDLFGEGKYASLDTQDRYLLELHGEALGTFTLEIQEVLDDQEVETISYINIPVASTTKAVMSLQTPDTASALEIDVEGDGITDFALNPMEGANAEISLEILVRVLNSLDANHKFIEKLMKDTEKAGIELRDGKAEKASMRFDKVIKRLEKEIKRNQKRLKGDDLNNTEEGDDDADETKQRISTQDAKALIQIITQIKLTLV